jgi:hypothetical protein
MKDKKWLSKKKSNRRRLRIKSKRWLSREKNQSKVRSRWSIKYKHQCKTMRKKK